MNFIFIVSPSGLLERYSTSRSVAKFIIGTLFVYFQLYNNLVIGQNLPSQDIANNESRRDQLLNHSESNRSFTTAQYEFNPYPFDAINERDTSNVIEGHSGRRDFLFLPVQFNQRFHGNPYFSRNDGIMIPSAGYQAMFSLGVSTRYGPLTVRLRPELVWAENKGMEDREMRIGGIDLPTAFGVSSYSDVSWGQSSIRLTFDPVSLGLSNESLWWGPGMQNSLLMSNTAPGFKHISLNTIRPISTPVGKFESQIIAGRLEGSSYTPDMREDWRYLSGLVFTVQPKWTPGLFLGFSRSFQIYGQDVGKNIGDLFPFFQAFQKANTDEDSKSRDQLFSVFARILLKNSNAEVYMEYGRNDHSYNVRDFLNAPEHSRAYTIGYSKIFKTVNRDRNYQFSAEFTRMEQSVDRLVRSAGTWYVHGQVRHGYTNKGQYVGAGIGSGGNLASLNFNRFDGLTKLGIHIERLEHSGDYANEMNYRQWVDLAFGLSTQRHYHKLVFEGKLLGIQSYNYLWQDGIDGREKKNAFNVNLDLGVLYRF